MDFFAKRPRRPRDLEHYRRPVKAALPLEAAIRTGPADKTDDKTFDISPVAAALRADASVRQKLEIAGT